MSKFNSQTKLRTNCINNQKETVERYFAIDLFYYKFNAFIKQNTFINKTSFSATSNDTIKVTELFLQQNKYSALK